MALTDYDKQNLSSSQRAAVEKATADWNAANARGDTAGMAAAHAAAEAARNSAGYTSNTSGNYSGGRSSGSSSGSVSRTIVNKNVSSSPSKSNSSSGSSGSGYGTGYYYKVNDDGKAPGGLNVGDNVVTAGGTYVITGKDANGAYTSRHVKNSPTTSTYTGSYYNVSSGAPYVPNTEQRTQTAQTQSGDALAAQLRALYEGQESSYAKALAEQKAAQEAAVQKAVNSIEGQKTTTNNAYSNLYRQAYIDRMNAQKNLNQRLAAQGVTGGAAESTMLGLSTAYSDALRQAEQQRIGAISDLDRAITDAQLTGDIESANAAANTIKEQTDRSANVLQSLLDRYDTLAARQTAYDREDAAANRSYAASRVNTALQNGFMPSDDELSAAGVSRDYAQSLLDAINAQRIRDSADYYAQYGDYSGLSDLGIDTSYLKAQQAAQLAGLTGGSGSSGGGRSYSGSSGGSSGTLTSGDIYGRLAEAGAQDYGTAYDMLRNSGYSVTDANRYAAYFAGTYLPGLSAGVSGSTGAGGMNDSKFSQEAKTIMQYLGQGMLNQAQSRLNLIWDDLSESQQQALNAAFSKNGYVK